MGKCVDAVGEKKKNNLQGNNALLGIPSAFFVEPEGAQRR